MGKDMLTPKFLAEEVVCFSLLPLCSEELQNTHIDFQTCYLHLTFNPTSTQPWACNFKRLSSPTDSSGNTHWMKLNICINVCRISIVHYKHNSCTTNTNSAWAEYSAQALGALINLYPVQMYFKFHINVWFLCYKPVYVRLMSNFSHERGGVIYVLK